VTVALLRQLHKLGVEVKEETAERAFRVFERQSEVDTSSQDARAFLREQFDLWMFQCVLSQVARRHCSLIVRPSAPRLTSGRGSIF